MGNLVEKRKKETGRHGAETEKNPVKNLVQSLKNRVESLALRGKYGMKNPHKRLTKHPYSI